MQCSLQYPSLRLALYQVEIPLETPIPVDENVEATDEWENNSLLDESEIIVYLETLNQPHSSQLLPPSMHHRDNQAF